MPKLHCTHKPPGRGRCYSCATGKPRVLIPGEIESWAPVKVSHEVKPLVITDPVQQAAWSRLWDILLSGDDVR